MVLTVVAMLMTAILFGGMVLYSFGFAAFLFSHLPAQEAGSILRKAFPVFLFVVYCGSAAGSGITALFGYDRRLANDICCADYCACASVAHASD